jgi:plasmid segregation protein ParM
VIKAVDLGFGAVKGISSARQIEYPSAVGTFRPVRFTSGMENQEQKDKLCIEFEGKRYFVGSIAFKQSAPRVTMNSTRFTSAEGLALMMSTLLLLSNDQIETVNLIAGLPVNEYAGLKDAYGEALQGSHYIQLIDPDGKENNFYRFNIEAVKILPQPVGTIFDKVLSDAGELSNKKLASGRLAVLDIGKHTVDLVLTDALQFVDRSSVSYSDIGLFDAFKDISLALKGKGYDLPADSLEPYITGNKQLKGLAEQAEQAYAAQAEKIISRVLNTWPDLWGFDMTYVTGGGALLLGDYLKQSLGSDKVEVCSSPTFTNCKGYYKFAQRLWK